MTAHHEPDKGLDELATKVIGAAIEVHRHHKAGYPENVYRDSMVVELELMGLKVQREVPVEVTYKGRSVGKGRIDLLVEGRLIVELKTVDAIGEAHVAQAITYLKATGRELALIINFKVAAIRGSAIKRVVYHQND
ncbi:MAG: GxxExxY protein [Planctomycetes bacterium]|jgi:GxxExxY protein|nr:GxxExxY protein [Planctomycetota bacterium]MCL4731117.1 GxxExxY protein [Planctomycetota bacterium]